MYLNKTVLELHELLVSKKVTPLELVNEAIEIIRSDDCKAYEATNFDAAIAKAKSIGEIKKGEYFKGIPYVAKDNFSTAGIETTASSNVLNGYVPLYDAEVISRLDKAGAILLAKTTMDELAMGGSGITGHKGVSKNPYDKSRIAGGSSCGSAIAVSRGEVPFALGSDTGDSVRKPASLVGIYGLKPTWGRISRYGLFPFAQSLDSVGYFARSVDDLAILTTLLAGYDEKDMSSSTHSSCDYLKESQHSDKKVVGYFPSIVDKLENKKITESFYRLIEKLEEEGYKVVRYDFNQDLLDAIYPAYMVISCAEATSNDANLDGIKFGIKPDGSARTWEEYMVSARTRGFSSLIKRRFIIGSYSLLAENQHDLFLRAQKVRRLIVNAVNEFFTKCDYLLLPTAQNVAKKIEDASDSWSKRPEYIDNHMAIGNFGGYPSLSEPLGYFEGLPYGVNITSRQFEEADLFNFARCIENIVGLKNSTVNSHKEGI